MTHGRFQVVFLFFFISWVMPSEHSFNEPGTRCSHYRYVSTTLTNVIVIQISGSLCESGVSERRNIEDTQELETGRGDTF